MESIEIGIGSDKGGRLGRMNEQYGKEFECQGSDRAVECDPVKPSPVDALADPIKVKSVIENKQKL